VAVADPEVPLSALPPPKARIAAFVAILLGGLAGGLIALAVFAGLIWAICKTTDLSVAVTPTRALTVRQIGEALMTDYVWPLQCVGVLLTAALIGALVLVMEERR